MSGPIRSNHFEVGLEFFYPWNTQQKLRDSEHHKLKSLIRKVTATSISFALDSDFFAYKTWKDIMQSGWYISHTICLFGNNNLHRLIVTKCSVIKELGVSELVHDSENRVTLDVMLAPGPYYEIVYNDIK